MTTPEPGTPPANPVGVCTWIFGHRDHSRIADQTAALGIDGVELFADIEHDSPAELARIYRARGLRFFSMTPANVDITHPDPNERRAAIRYYERLFTFAAALGCPRVTCHETVGRTRPPDGAEPEWARLVESCRRLAESAADHALQLAFEPLHRGLVSQVHHCADLERLLQEVGHPALGGVVDTFHMDREAEEPTLGIRSLGARVVLVQLADRERKALGTGGAPLAANLAALASIDYHGPLVLECNPQLPGPSLDPQPVDPDLLERTLQESMAWLTQRIPGLLQSGLGDRSGRRHLHDGVHGLGGQGR